MSHPTLTDKERIHRWITQADLERMMDEAHKRGVQWAIDELRVQCQCNTPGCPACLVAHYLERGGPS